MGSVNAYRAITKLEMNLLSVKIALITVWIALMNIVLDVIMGTF